MGKTRNRSSGLARSSVDKLSKIMKKLILSFFISSAFSNLMTPEDGAILNRIHVLFEWKQIPEAISYDLQVSEEMNFSSIIFETIDSSLVHIERDNLNWFSTYYWRVRANFNNYSSEWLLPFSFTTTEALSSSSIEYLDESQYQEGLTVFGAFFNYFSAAIDHTGKEVWNSGANDFVYYSANSFGNVFGCNLFSGTENNLPGMEISFQNEIIWEEPNDEFLHHDIIKLPNGNYLGIVETNSLGPIPIGGWTASFQNLGFQADGVTIEFPWVGDKLVEWDKDTKEVVWTWNTFDHFSMLDFDQYGGTWTEAYLSLHYDWTHVNAVIFDESESAIYISTRHLSRITKINYPSGEIIWNLGHEMPSGQVNLGTEIGFSFQHSIQKLENGNILTFDNGNLSPEFRGTDQPISRAIEIEIDDNSAVIAWSYDLPPDLFGFASGNAQKLDNGNVLMTTVGGGGRSLEINPQGELIWEGLYNLSLPDGAVYRAHRIPGLYPAAYSVMINNFMETNGIGGVFLPTGSSNISFSITNEGPYYLPLLLQIFDDEGWFGSQTLEILLEPNTTQAVSFNGNIAINTNFSSIQLLVEPVYHPDKAKTVSFIGYNYPLSNDKSNNTMSDQFSLNNPFPNPFNTSISINFSLSQFQHALLQVFNTKGQLIQTLVNQNLSEGTYNNNWNAINQSTGVYIVKLTTSNSMETQKILYLK